ncbi:MAG: glycosyltransferase, partial [Acidimicrobiales bacterium]
MRVLHVINSLSGSGGAEQGLVREITHFGEGHEQLVVTLYRPDHLALSVESTGIEQESLGLDPSHSGWNWAIAVSRLRRVIQRHDPQVVHSSLFSGNLVAQLATRNSRLPTLSTFTLSGDVALMQAYQPGADSGRAAMLRRFASWASRSDHVWFRALTADALATNCSALGVLPSRGVVIPRGIPIPDPAESSSRRSDLGLPEDVPIVLNVGRQSAQKGHEHLIAAFQELLHSRSAHLVILGREGDGTPALNRAIAISGLDAHVTVIPYTDRVYDFYAHADVFAFPTLMEGLGTSVLEAMAAQLPVVAFDIPPVREISDDGRVATLVPIGDTDAFVAALESAIDSGPDVRRLQRVNAQHQPVFDKGNSV